MRAYSAAALGAVFVTSLLILLSPAGAQAQAQGAAPAGAGAAGGGGRVQQAQPAQPQQQPQRQAPPAAGAMLPDPVQAKLYLRCVQQGEAGDEYTAECCDHVTVNVAKRFKVCGYTTPRTEAGVFRGLSWDQALNTLEQVSGAVLRGAL